MRDDQYKKEVIESLESIKIAIRNMYKSHLSQYPQSEDVGLNTWDGQFSYNLFILDCSLRKTVHDLEQGDS